MIKATAKSASGREVLIVGLSFGNLTRFHAEPLESFIRINGEDMNLPIDVIIFSGETEAAMAHKMESLIGPNTKVHVDPRLKS